MTDPLAQLHAWRRSIRDADEATLSKRSWHACYTRSRHEKRVASVLRDRGLEVYLPSVSQERRWHDRRRVVELPLFPGYVFAKVTANEIFDVTYVPSVVSIVMADGRPARISESEIENIWRYARAVSTSGMTMEPYPLLEVGERVVVREGPFKDVEGIVVNRRGDSRIVVGILALGQGFSVNIPLRHLRKVSVAAPL